MISDYVRCKFLLDEKKPDDGSPTTGVSVGGHYECDAKFDFEKLLTSSKDNLWIQMPVHTFNEFGLEVQEWALAVIEPASVGNLMRDCDVFSEMFSVNSRRKSKIAADRSSFQCTGQSTDCIPLISPDQCADQSPFRSPNQSTNFPSVLNRCTVQSSHRLANQLSDESIFQSNFQTADQSTSFSTIECTVQSSDRLANQLSDESIFQSNFQTADQSTSFSTIECTVQSINRLANQSADQFDDQSTFQSAFSCPLRRTTKILTSTLLKMNQNRSKTSTFVSSASKTTNANTESTDAAQVTVDSSYCELYDVTLEMQAFKKKLLETLTADPPASVIKKNKKKHNFYYQAVREPQPKLNSCRLRIDNDLFIHLIHLKVSAPGLDAMYTLFRKSKSDDWMIHPQNVKYSLFVGEIDYDFREKLQTLLVG